MLTLFQLKNFVVSIFLLVLCLGDLKNIIKKDNKETKKNVEIRVSVKTYGAKGDGITNDWAAIQKAVSIEGALIYFPSGTYKVDSFIRVANGVKIIGNTGSIIISSANIKNDLQTGSAHQGQIFILGSNCMIKGLKIDGRNYNAGGICLAKVSGTSVLNCTILNTGTAQGIQDYLSHSTTYKDNIITNCKSGIQLWLTDNCTITGNKINRCDAGGIWGANSSNVNCSNNNVQNCKDVGIDWEGGQNIINENNVVKSCNNGELAVFRNAIEGNQMQENIQFNHNNVTRSVTYLNRLGKRVPCNVAGGALFVSSINGNCKGIVFRGNNVNVLSGYGIYTNDLQQRNTNIIFADNVIKSSDKFFRIQGTDGVLIKANTFKGLQGAELQSNEFKNATGIKFQDNNFSYTNLKKVNAVMTWFTDRKLTGERPVLINNRFLNAGDLALRHDPYISGFACVLQGNFFTEGYTVNGGVSSTSNGRPLFVNQKLKLKVNGVTKELLKNSNNFR